MTEMVQEVLKVVMTEQTIEAMKTASTKPVLKFILTSTELNTLDCFCDWNIVSGSPTIEKKTPTSPSYKCSKNVLILSCNFNTFYTFFFFNFLIS